MSRERDAIERLRAIYDESSDVFLRYAGATFQSGLLRTGPSRSEDPTRHNLEIARRAGLRDGALVLDGGCGVGGPAMDVAEAFPNVRFEGITVSPVQVELGTKLAVDRDLSERVHLQVGDFHHLPFPDDTFDLVWYLESAEYSWDQDRLFAEAWRVLKRGGRLYQKGLYRRDVQVSDVALEHLRELEQTWGFSVPLPTPPETLRAIRDAGFEVERAGLLDGEVGQERYVGAMIDIDDDGLPRLNEFGRRVFVPHADIPLCYAECAASKCSG